MRKWIGVALLALMMTLAVMTATVISGEAETSHFVDTDKMVCETGEADSHVAPLLGMTVPAIVNYDSADESDEEEIFHSCERLEMTEGVVYRTDIPLDAREQAALIEACREFNVPYELVLAVIWQETDYRNVIGDDGNSMGYMQLQPRWVWPEMEELSATDLMDPADNFRVGCCLLGRYIETHGIEGGLTRYNTGSPGWSAYAEEVLEKWEVLKG